MCRCFRTSYLYGDQIELFHHDVGQTLKRWSSIALQKKQSEFLWIRWSFEHFHSTVYCLMHCSYLRKPLAMWLVLIWRRDAPLGTVMVPHQVSIPCRAHHVGDRSMPPCCHAFRFSTNTGPSNTPPSQRSRALHIVKKPGRDCPYKWYALFHSSQELIPRIVAGIAGT